MTPTLQREPRNRRNEVIHAEGPADQTVKLAVPGIVPEHLLDGGEIVHIAIKPSMWHVPLVSFRWLALGIAMMFFSTRDWFPGQFKWYTYYAGCWIALGRVAWAILEWVSTLYVLTNYRVLRLRGVFTVDLFECRLRNVQNTFLTASIGERITRTGTITFQTAGSAGTASWRMVARPWEVHEQVVAAIRRSQDRNGNGSL